MEKSKKIVVILGPTASGKSDLAVKIAKKFNGEIISVDSRQVYKGLNIGTGKITKKEMLGIPHYMLDVIEPKRKFSVVKFVRMAEKAINKIIKRGHLPIICGGTGFYISALIDKVQFPDVRPNTKLRKKLEKITPDKLLSILKKLDPKRAKVIDKNNTRKIIRAIEVARQIGSVPALKNDRSGTPNTLFMGTKIDPVELRKRIGIRLMRRIKNGMIEEVRKLHRQGLSFERMEELGLEYRYLARFLKDEMGKNEMIKKLETEIWHYARRQMTWFRRDKRILWLSPKDIKLNEKIVRQFLRQKIT